jgi:hypothetical protein
MELQPAGQEILCAFAFKPARRNGSGDRHPMHRARVHPEDRGLSMAYRRPTPWAQASPARIPDGFATCPSKFEARVTGLTRQGNPGFAIGDIPLRAHRP